MARTLEPKKIKSAHRALEVLKYFNECRQEATVMDIARAMNCPQSSTSELLSCLVALGYLHRDRYARTYRPTARVALLGAWVQPKLFRQGHLLHMMDGLVASSSATVFLAARIGNAVQYIHVVAAPDASPEPPPEGTIVPLLRSAAGKMLLATHDRGLLCGLIRRLNAEIDDVAGRVSYADFVEELDAVLGRRYALQGEVGGGAVLSVLLPRRCSGPSADEQIALGVFGAPSFIQENEEKLVRLLRGTIARRFGPVRVVTQSSVPQPTGTPAPTELPRQAVG